MPILMSLDTGARAIKAVVATHSLVLPSSVAVKSQNRLHGLAGLHTRKRPLTIITHDGEFFVGLGAHDLGRPVENFDFDRLSGTPEMRALVYGAFTSLLPADCPEPIDLIVGLPVSVMMGNDATTTIKQVKAFLGASHTWQADGQPRTLTISNVRVTAQPVGALFEFFLDENGLPRPEHRAIFQNETGVMNLGMSTVDLLVARGGQVIERFTAGEAMGVRRLLSLLNLDGLYTLAELDEQLRAGHLQAEVQVTLWSREVFGFVDQVWGRARQRFARVIATGGGVYLLKDTLLRRFGANLYLAADPVMATAVGLYRLGLRQTRKEA